MKSVFVIIFLQMRNYRPLVLQELNIQLPGVKIRRLRLNRHLAKVDRRAPHQHRFSQFLLYLAGKGFQKIGREEFAIEAGSLVFIAARTSHAFRNTGGRPPLCLVIDFEWHAGNSRKSNLIRLARMEFGQVKHELSRITKLHPTAKKAPPIQASASILSILGIFATQTRLTEQQEVTSSGIRPRVDRLLRADDGIRLSMKELAQRAGYQVDYLNRIFKQESGLTLGQYRGRLLANKAKNLLAQRNWVQDVAEELGFEDQNYFARWFRHQTGERPKHFLQAKLKMNVIPLKIEKIGS